MTECGPGVPVELIAVFDRKSLTLLRAFRAGQAEQRLSREEIDELLAGRLQLRREMGAYVLSRAALSALYFALEDRAQELWVHVA